jgi:diaminopimelate decarboxylase
MCRIIKEAGLSLDVVSGGELYTAKKAGFPGERIEFHGNNKSDVELDRALAAGIGRIVLDSIGELGRLVKAIERSPRQGPPVDVMLRVRVGVEAHTHEYIATAHEDQKFGISLHDGSALAAAQLAAASPVLNLIGLHSHIGSQIFDSTAYSETIRRLVGLHAQVAQTTGHIMPELGLGGGFGVAYTTGHDPEPAEVVAGHLASALVQACDEQGLTTPRVSVEPGRAIAAPAGITLYTVGALKRVALSGGYNRLYVAVDGGMSDNVRTALYSADYSATLASRRSDAPPVLARVVGKHCESGDIIVKDEYLPDDIASGDLLAVPVTGAYCYSLASNYNQTPRPAIVSVRDGKLHTLVRRETEADLAVRDCD